MDADRSGPGVRGAWVVIVAHRVKDLDGEVPRIVRGRAIVELARDRRAQAHVIDRVDMRGVVRSPIGKLVDAGDPAVERQPEVQSTRRALAPAEHRRRDAAEVRMLRIAQPVPWSTNTDGAGG